MRLRALLVAPLLVAAAAAGTACGTSGNGECTGGSTPTVSADVACQIARAPNPNYLDPACAAACNAGSSAMTCTLPADFLRAYESLNPGAGVRDGGGAEGGSPEGGSGDGGALRCPTSPARVTIVCSPYCA